MKKVRVGFVGAGGIANAHMDCISRMEGVEVVGICDVVREKAERAAGRFGCRAYTSYEELLEKEPMDALFVCVPPHAHGMEIMAAKRGIAIMVEKPIARTLEMAREIERAIAESGVISSVAYHWRYMNSVKQAKEILSGRKIAMALGYWIGGLPGVPWWRVKDQGGGQVIEQTTHIFDLARYMVGDVDEVYGVAFKGLMEDVPGYNVEDASTVTLKFKNGAIGNITSSCIVSQGYMVGLNLLTRDLVVEITGGSLRVRYPGRTEEIRETAWAYYEEDKAFLEAVRTGDRSGIRSTYSDGLETLRVTLAAEESFVTGKPVKL
jgi:myo-inositol 2-dehydrogenase/D-chiro-inositol 1-dehydrogenase